MSDAREKAMAAYMATFPDGCVGTETIPDDFGAGWDAAKADLPDRETIGEVLALVDGYDGCHQRVRDWEALPDWEKQAHPDEEPFTDREDAEFWNLRADAVLALFRGEEPK